MKPPYGSAEPLAPAATGLKNKAPSRGVTVIDDTQLRLSEIKMT